MVPLLYQRWGIEPMMSQKPTGMQSKQKIMVGIISIVFIILVWQVIGMFGAGKSQPAELKPVQTKARPVAMDAQPKAAIVATPTPTVAQAPVPKGPEVIAQQETQQKYIESLTELQMLRIKKDIAETNQAITTAKLATATAEKNISDLLVAPVMPNKVTQPGSLDSDQMSHASPNIIKYTVNSVAMQDGKWTALIENQGKTYNVSVNDILPPDNSRVVKIGREGVILEKDGEQTKISIISSI